MKNSLRATSVVVLLALFLLALPLVLQPAVHQSQIPLTPDYLWAQRAYPYGTIKKYWIAHCTRHRSNDPCTHPDTCGSHFRSCDVPGGITTLCKYY